MPVITEEEMGSNVLASDFSQLLDLPDTTIEPLELAQVDPDSTEYGLIIPVAITGLD